MDYTKLKVGDVVKLVSERPPAWNDKGRMDHYLNSIQTIHSIGNKKRTDDTAVSFKEGGPWAYILGDIACLHYEEPVEPQIINHYQIY